MTKNMWMLVRPGEQPEAWPDHDNMDIAARARAIGRHELDFGSISPVFHYCVYEHSISDGWPHNFTFVRRGGQYPVHGPALIFKVDGRGETIDMTTDDIEMLGDWINACRLGLMIDGANYT